jgi:mannose-1-phosphate guanylyltransferase
MLQETADRVCPDIVSADRLYVITNRRHVSLAREQLAQTPAENIVGEPMGRDSAPAVGVMAALIEKRLGADAVMIVLPADHVILDPKAFREALSAAVDVAKKGSIVTLGITPTGPDTGFGYIQRGDDVKKETPAVYSVDRFREKPDRKTAEEYVRSGRFYWNAGMYVATVGTFRSLYKKNLPEMDDALVKLADSVGTDDQESIFDEIFPSLTKISIDYGIIEKAENVAVAPVSMGWDDAGSWGRLANILQAKADSTGSVATAGEIRMVDSSHILAHAPGKLVAVIGLNDIVIIDTPDALLVADRSRSEDVKKIVEQLQAEGRKDLL